MAIEATSAVSTTKRVAQLASAPSAAVEQLADALSDGARGKILDLDINARLWVREGKALRRVGVIESLERWASGKPVAIVTRLQNVKSESHDSSALKRYDFTLFDDDHLSRSSSRSETTLDVAFTYELVTNPQLLMGFVRSGVGIHGTGELPAEGGTARVSSTYRWESSEARSHAYWLKSRGGSTASAGGSRVTT